MRQSETNIGKLRSRVTTQFPSAEITSGCNADMICCLIFYFFIEKHN